MWKTCNIIRTWSSYQRKRFSGSRQFSVNQGGTLVSPVKLYFPTDLRIRPSRLRGLRDSLPVWHENHFIQDIWKPDIRVKCLKANIAQRTKGGWTEYPVDNQKFSPQTCICSVRASLTKQRVIILPVYVSGARMVPSTMGSKYSDTTDLSGNWAGFTTVISSLPCSWKKNQWHFHLHMKLARIFSLSVSGVF